VFAPVNLPYGCDGITSESTHLQTGRPQVDIHIAFDPTKRKTPEYHDFLTYTFLHELGDHALGMCDSLSQNKVSLPEMVDHYKVFAPSDESNAWHTVVKSALTYVPDDLKVHF
jgi:hypothetical protein